MTYIVTFRGGLTKEVDARDAKRARAIFGPYTQIVSVEPKPTHRPIHRADISTTYGPSWDHLDSLTS